MYVLSVTKKVQLSFIRHEKGVSQVEMARRMETSQNQIYRMERDGADHLVSTLERYAVAIGAKLEVSIIDGNKRVPLAVGSQSEDGE